METAFPLQLQRSVRRESFCVTSFSTPPKAADDRRHLPPPENARSPMRDLIRKRITASTTNSFRFNQTTKLLCGHSFAVNSIKEYTMADEANKEKKNSSLIESTIKQEEVKKAPTNIPPPPPEKPLPGDCCGSGCVRCVWDVYYEELEEYNKLYKSSPDSNRPS